MIVGERIKTLRKEKGLTQKQLAEALNLNNTTISHYENDKRMPDLDFLTDLSSYLEVDINRLLGTEYMVKNDNGIQQISVDELNCILELRKTRNYKRIISDPKRLAKVVDQYYSKN